MAEIGGEDSEGKAYKSISEMWTAELATEDGRKSWYAKATSHWQAQEPTLTGIMGGYPETNGPDLRESRRFLDQLRGISPPPEFDSALDCGAGIGRVTSGLLLHVFNRVDLVEQDQRLLDAARSEIVDKRAERFMSSSLQAFEPEPDRYNVIWVQWVLLYLPDDDLVRFLERCVRGLRRNGVICVKENVTQSSWLVDREDNSIARTDAQYKAIFERAHLQLVHELEQACWPTDLIPVRMYALRPATSGRATPPVAPVAPVRPVQVAPRVKKKPAAAK